MTDLPLFAAWFITYGVVFFIIAMGATIICALGIFANSNFFLVFLMFFLFGLASISFSYFISAFFSRSKTAAVLGTILFLVAFFPYFSVSENTKVGAASPAAACDMTCCPDAYAPFPAPGPPFVRGDVCNSRRR